MVRRSHGEDYLTPSPSRVHKTLIPLFDSNSSVFRWEVVGLMGSFCRFFFSRDFSELRILDQDIKNLKLI